MMKFSFLLRGLNSGILQIRTYRRLSRRPLKIIPSESMKGKTLEEYTKESQRMFVPHDSNDEIFNSNEDAVPIYPNLIHEEEDKKTKEAIKDDVLESHMEIKRKGKPSPLNQVLLSGLKVNLYSKAPSLKKLLASSKAPKLRKKNDVIFLEGWRLISEALSSNITPQAIFYSRTNLLSKVVPNNLDHDQMVTYLNMLPLYKTPYKSLQTWSSLDTTPGIMGIFTLSEATKMCLKERESTFPLTVVIDNVRDPSNLGAIIRTMAAVSIEKLLITKGCCDIWDIKVLRAACGGHFRISMKNNIEWSHMSSYLSEDPLVYLADSATTEEEATSEQFEKASFHDPPSEEMLNRICFDQEKENLHVIDEYGESVSIDEDYHDKEHLRLFQHINLPVQIYNEISYFKSSEPSKHMLIIGGETGLSNEAKKFAFINSGIKVAIPMENGMDSLNSPVATAIIAYEMRQNFLSISSKYKELSNE